MTCFFVVEKSDMDETISVLDSNSKNADCPRQRGAILDRTAKKKTSDKNGFIFAYQITSFTLVQQLLGKPFVFHNYQKPKHSKERGKIQVDSKTR